MTRAAYILAATLAVGCGEEAASGSTALPQKAAPPVAAPAKAASPPNATPAADSELLRTGKPLYSQQKEELIIRDFFRDRRDGVFLDVGAGHYQRYSTTFYLEEKLGWTGFAVDALAEYADDYAKHRPGTKFLNYLVTDKVSGPQKFYRATKLTEVSSADKKVAQDQARRYRNDDSVTEIEVEATTLNAILEAQDVERIDLLSMDIEEHEPAALAGFDIERYRPALVCIEAHAPVQPALTNYFAAHGYQRLDQYLPHDGVNWYFAPAKMP